MQHIAMERDTLPVSLISPPTCSVSSVYANIDLLAFLHHVAAKETTGIGLFDYAIGCRDRLRE
jgi:hypothetical protein